MSMKPAKIYSYTIAGNGAVQVLIAGRFFKILSSTGACRVESPNFQLDGIGTGQGIEDTPFERLVITDQSGASNVVRFVIADEGFIDGTLGAVSISANKVPQVTAFVHTQRTVTNVAAQLASADAARQFAAIQNNSLTGIVTLVYSGQSPVAGLGAGALGIRILPGGYHELNGIAVTGPIGAVGDIASNPDVQLITG